MKRFAVAMIVVLGASSVLWAQGLSAFEVARQTAEVEHQRTLAKVNELMTDIEKLLQAGQLVDAELKSQEASRLVITSRSLSLDEQNSLKAQVAALSDQVAAKKAAYLQSKEVAANQEIARREVERRAADELFGKKQLEDHWARVKEFRQERQYENALAEAQAILKTNPNDEQARRVAEDMAFQAAMTAQINNRVSRGVETQASLAAVENSAIPYSQLVTYPRDWEQKSYTRLAGMLRERGTSAPSERAMGQLHARVPLNMKDVSLSNVLTYLSEATKTPIVIDPRTKEDSGKDPDQELVNLTANGLTVEQILKMILPPEMGYRVEDGQIVVSGRDKANPLKLVSYPVQDMVTEIPDFGSTVPRFNLTNTLNQTQGGQGGQGGTGGGGSGGLFDPETSKETPPAEMGKKLIDMIKKFVVGDPSIAAWEDAGGTATIEYFNGCLLINQTEAGHRKVVEILNKL